MGNDSEQVGGKLSPVDLNNYACAIDVDTPPEEVIQLIQLCQYYEQQIKLVRKAAENVGISWVNHNGDIQYEDLDGNVIRHYVGTVKTTKLKPDSKAAAIMAILDATGGDLDAMAELLAAQPVKHGACKKVLTEEVWGELFETVEQEDLKTGKPKKALITINSRFLKG